MISAAITQHSGSSAVFDYGFVTYANAAKTALVGVDAALLEQVGAVSAEVAQAMAEGGLKRSGADFCLSVTGIAGPTGGSVHKPVGLVFIGLACKAAITQVQKHVFDGESRQTIREQATLAAFNLLKQNLS
jgi:nicotinamide-nucleotide amidase